MSSVYNFSASPATLPEEVVSKAALELSNYKGRGISVMEIDTGSDEYVELLSTCERLFRELIGIPQNYKVLFVQGNETAQFSAIPMNMLSAHRCADYIISGQFSKNASTEAKKYGDVAIAASSAGASPTYSTVPDTKRSDFRPDADYVHICFNNRIYGTKFHYVPDTGNIPLVADMTSYLLSEPFEISKFALVYAGAQCNIGANGLTVLILRDDFLGGARGDTPALLNYKALVEMGSIFNTPPAFSVYMAKLMLEWIVSIGGLEEMKRRNERKASLLYDYLDGQNYYTAPVDKKCRSMMNVVFVTGDAALDKKFAKEAEKRGLMNLKGHSSVGGMRASIYNSMPYEGVEALVKFMKEFAQLNIKLDG